MRNYSKKGKICSDEEMVLSTTITGFTTKEREVPIPYSQTGGDSCFVVGMEKFSEVVSSISKKEVDFLTSIEAISERIQLWIKQELQEKTKALKKRFDNTKGEFEKGTAKVSSLQKTGDKPIAITKLYLAELELVKLKHEFEEATTALENHCDDIQFKTNFFVSNQLIDWFSCYKQMIDFSYLSVDDIKGYVEELKLWCKDEEDIFLTHSQSRNEKRDEIHQDMERKYIVDFILVFNNHELVQSIAKAIEQECPTNQFLPLFVSMFKGYQLDVPGGLSDIQGDGSDGEAAFKRVVFLIRDNFDAIGNKLIEEGKKDSLVQLGQVLSSLEKPNIKA